MNNNIKDIINEYNDLKKELIPLDRVTTENNNLVFFQDKSLKELENNQSLSYQNIGEGLERIIQTINDYIEKIKGLSVSESSTDRINKEYLISSINNNQFSLSLQPLNNQEYYAYNLINYKNSAIISTNIDQIIITPNCALTDIDSNTIDCEPVIYWLDAEDRTIKKYSPNTPFKPNTIFSVLLIGIKVNENISKDTKLIIKNLTYDIEIRYDSLQTNKNTFKIGSSFNELTLPYNIKEQEIPFFDIVDIFGNMVTIKTANSQNYLFTPQSNLRTAGEQSTRDVDNVLMINDIPIPMLNWEKLLITKGFNSYKNIDLTKFKIYKLPSQKNYVYFPSGASIVQDIKETIDEF